MAMPTRSRNPQSRSAGMRKHGRPNRFLSQQAGSCLGLDCSFAVEKTSVREDQYPCTSFFVVGIPQKVLLRASTVCRQPLHLLTRTTMSAQIMQRLCKAFLVWRAENAAAALFIALALSKRVILKKLRNVDYCDRLGLVAQQLLSLFWG